MILSTLAVVGIIGIFRSHAYFGFVHSIPLVWQNQLYAKQSFSFVALQTCILAIKAFTLSGFLRSAFLSICLKLYEMERTVFSALPALVAFIKVFIINALFLVACWGRSLASRIQCILVGFWLEWFRIPAWGAGDPGFKSPRPHQTTS